MKIRSRTWRLCLDSTLYAVRVKIDVDANGEVTPANLRGLLIAATFEADGVFGVKVASWTFTCPDCGADEGEWPVTIVLGTPYSHEC